MFKQADLPTNESVYKLGYKSIQVSLGATWDRF